MKSFARAVAVLAALVTASATCEPDTIVTAAGDLQQEASFSNLLATCSPLNQEDKDRALLGAIGSGSLPNSLALLESGASPAAPGALVAALRHPGLTKLHLRLIVPKEGTAATDPNARDPATGLNVLATCISQNLVTESLSLLEAGADANFVDASGTSVLTHALQRTADAAVRADIEKVVVRLLEKKATIGPHDLAIAVANGAEAAVNALIKSGADANSVDSAGNHVLSVAVNAQSLSFVNALIAAGASPDGASASGVSALGVAVYNHAIGISTTLVNAGAKVATVTPAGVPVVASAVEQGEESLADLLLDKGASCDARGTDGSHIFAIALSANLPKIASRLARCLDVHLPCSHHLNAAVDTAPELLFALVNRGAAAQCPNLRNEKGNTLLCMALERADDQFARKVLGYHASRAASAVAGYVNLHCEQNETAIVKAYNSLPTFLDDLVRVGASADVLTAAGEPLLAVAVNDMKADLVHALLPASRDVNVQMGGSSLLSLAIKKTPTIVDELVAAGAHPDGVDEIGTPALITAIELGHEHIVDILLAKKANVLATKAGVGPLIFSIKSLPSFALRLVHAGADVNSQDAQHVSALIHAIKSDMIGLALELINRNAAVNVADENGASALSLGLSSPQLVAQLLAHGASADSVDASRVSVLITAIKSYPDVVEALLNAGADANAADPVDGTSALIVAIENQRAAAVAALIARKANLNASKNGASALALALQHLPSVAYDLVVNGADVNSQDAHGNYVLTIALKAKLQNVCLALLKRGVNVSVYDMDGESALPLAIEVLPSVALEVIAAGANVNSQNVQGDYALGLAITHGLEAVALELINRGAAIDSVDRDHDRALSLAVKHKETRVAIELLKQAGADPNEKDPQGNHVLTVAIQNDMTTVALELLALKADVNATDKDGDSALPLAVERDLEQVALKLIELRADYDAKSKNGQPVLITLVNKGSFALINALLNAGASVDTRDTLGQTALIVSIINGNDDLALFLINRGANLDVADFRGNKALTLAIQGRMQKLAELLARQSSAIDTPDSDGEYPIMVAINYTNVNVCMELIARKVNPFPRKESALHFAAEMATFENGMLNVLSAMTKMESVKAVLGDGGIDNFRKLMAAITPAPKECPHYECPQQECPQQECPQKECPLLECPACAASGSTPDEPSAGHGLRLNTVLLSLVACLLVANLLRMVSTSSAVPVAVPVAQAAMPVDIPQKYVQQAEAAYVPRPVLADPVPENINPSPRRRSGSVKRTNSTIVRTPN